MDRKLVAKDLAGRLAQALEQGIDNPLILIIAILAIVTLIGLAIFGKRRALFFLLIMTFPFSGSVWAAADTYSTLLRWFLLGLLALTVVHLRVRPGISWGFYVAYLVLSIAFGIVFSPSVFTIQHSILFICLVLSTASLAQDMRDPSQLSKICMLFIAPVVVWTAAAILNFSSLSQVGRFSGGFTAAGFFVITGGMCLPFVVWGAMRPGSMKWRIPLALLVPLIVFFLFASGSRTGTFAGVIGCVPFVFRRKFGKMLGIGFILTICLGSIWYIQFVNQDQAKFLVNRFLSTNTTGRAEVWEEVLRERLLPNPFIGHGPSSNLGLAELSRYGLGTHNAYLSIWYDSSIFGLLLFLAAVAIAYWQAGTEIIRRSDPSSRELARLLLGVLMATTASGLFEAKLSAPSQIPSFLFLLACVALERLHAFNTTKRAIQTRRRTLALKPMPGRINHSSLT